MNEAQIRQLAEALLPQFIPKDDHETDLSFNFTVPPKQTFQVWFKKTKLTWNYVRHEKIVI